jgi:hypothetical protein
MSQEAANPFIDFVTAVQTNGGKWWVEELVVRGEPGPSDGGTIRGAHVVVGAEFPNPIPGQLPVKQLSPLMPLSVVPDTVGLATLFPEALRVSMRDLEGTRVAVAALKTERDELTKSLADKVKELEDASTALDKKDDALTTAMNLAEARLAKLSEVKAIVDVPEA